MSTPIIANLEGLLGGPRDNALLRYALGNEYLKTGQIAKAIAHLYAATEGDATYSAAWKVLGKALSDDGRLAEALVAYERGIAVAEGKGDVQAAKEMTVFARRLRRRLTENGAGGVA